jgi:hypothetical protein
VTDERFAPPRANVEQDELALEPIGAPRLHRVSAVALAALLGGALPAGYLVYRNNVLLGRRRDAWIALGLFVVLFLATQYAQMRSPSDFISRISVAPPRMLAATLAAWILQRRLLRVHEHAGGRFRSRWFGLLLGIGFLVAWIAVWDLGYWVMRSAGV